MYGIFSTLEGVCIRESGLWMRGEVSCYASGHRSKRRAARSLFIASFILLFFWGLDLPLSSLTPSITSFYLCSASAHQVLSQDPRAQREQGAKLQRWLVKAEFVVNELPLLLGTSRVRLCNLDLIRRLIKSAWSLLCSDSGGHGVFFEEHLPPLESHILHKKFKRKQLLEVKTETLTVLVCSTFCASWSCGGFRLYWHSVLCATIECAKQPPNPSLFFCLKHPRQTSLSLCTHPFLTVWKAF